MFRWLSKIIMFCFASAMRMLSLLLVEVRGQVNKYSRRLTDLCSINFIAIRSGLEWKCGDESVVHDHKRLLLYSCCSVLSATVCGFLECSVVKQNGQRMHESLLRVSSHMGYRAVFLELHSARLRRKCNYINRLC